MALLGVALLGLITAGVVVTRVIGAGSEPTAGSGSILEDAAWLRPAFEERVDAQWLASARKLEIRERSARLVVQSDGVARLYAASPNHSVQRRGGARLIAAEPFELRELDLSLVPALVRDSQARTGMTIMRLVVGRDEEGLLLWRAEFAGAADVYFYADGTFVDDPNDP
jgi:hypothetical protein